MPTAAERAKAKYQAVIDNPNRNDASSRIPDVQELITLLTGKKHQITKTG
jgi:hypothetical protein